MERARRLLEVGLDGAQLAIDREHGVVIAELLVDGAGVLEQRATGGIASIEQRAGGEDARAGRGEARVVIE